MCDLWQRRYRGLYSAVLGYVETSVRENITLVVSVEGNCIWCDWFIKNIEENTWTNKGKWTAEN
jgi:hypothetical protein